VRDFAGKPSRFVRNQTNMHLLSLQDRDAKALLNNKNEFLLRQLEDRNAVCITVALKKNKVGGGRPKRPYFSDSNPTIPCS
jgi:hypothetical protein